MAVYTHISEETLRDFLAGFDLGRLHKFEGIASGVENSNYAIVTERGRYILTLYEKRVQRRDLPFFLDLMEHLAGKGIECPLPVADRAGRHLFELAGRPAAVVTFLEGAEAVAITPAHCRAVGHALARLHEAGKDFSGSRSNDLGLDGWRRLAQRCDERLNEIADGLADLVAGELDYQAASKCANLPIGVIHADLFPDNVFFKEGRISGLIDFYFACTDTFAYDVAVALNAWCFDSAGTFVPARATALAAGYIGARALQPAEEAALVPLARGAALRFLLTRAYDWLNPEAGALVRPKDPRDYLHRLRFWQEHPEALTAVRERA